MGSGRATPVSGAAKAALAAAMSRIVSALLNFFLDLGTFFTDSEPATVTCSHEVSDIQPWASASGGAAFLGALLRGALALTGAPEAGERQLKAD